MMQWPSSIEELSPNRRRVRWQFGLKAIFAGCCLGFVASTTMTTLLAQFLVGSLVAVAIAGVLYGALVLIATSLARGESRSGSDSAGGSRETATRPVAVDGGRRK